MFVHYNIQYFMLLILVLTVSVSKSDAYTSVAILEKMSCSYFQLIVSHIIIA